MKRVKIEVKDQIVMSSVIKMMERSTKREWVGTMTQLQKTIKKMLSKQEVQMMPQSPAGLRLSLNRIVNRIRNRRIGVKFSRATNSVRTRYVKFVK